MRGSFVFGTNGPDYTRLSLHEGFELWPSALELAAHAPDRHRQRIAFLEFVRDDDPAQLATDGATLRLWLDDQR